MREVRRLRQLEAVERIHRSFLDGVDFAEIGPAVVAAAVDLSGARVGELLGESPPSHEPLPPGRVLIPLVGRTGPSGVLALDFDDADRAAADETIRELAPFLDASGILLRASRNLADTARLEQHLTDSEDLHRIIIEMGYEYTYVATIENGTVRVYSPRPDLVNEFIGFSEDANWMNDWPKAIDERDRAVVEKQVRDLFSLQICRGEMRLSRRTPEGRTRWVEKVERMVRGPGDQLRVFGAVRDITAAKEAAEQLREREQELSAILEAEPECVKSIDAEGRLLHMNPAGLRMIEADSLEQVRGASVYDLIAPSSRETFRELHARVMAGESVVQEFELRGLRGTRRWMETHAAPLRNEDGEVVSHLAITRDVTDRRRLQEDMIAAQRREALGVMAGGIAHDFNNMLYVILGRSELALRKAGAGSPLARDLTEIREAARRAAAVTQQILTFSRGSTGEDAPVDLVATLTEAVAMLRVTLPSSIEIYTRGARHAHRVLGDPGQLLQIVVNLATNASHALRDAAQAEIEFSIERVDIDRRRGTPEWSLPPGSYVRLRTRDNGCGMSSEVRMRALEPYFSTRLPAEGSGLGLAVVDGIARRLGGAVRIDSEPGVGTTVDVMLPVYLMQPGAADETADEVIGGNETILLVDDEPLVCRTEQQLLESLGYTVVIALDAVEGMRAFRSDPDRYDLVLTDQTMPKMNGDDLAREVVRQRPDLPVILCTGLDERLSAERAQKAGIRACLTKPIDLEQLARTVRTVLDQREPQLVRPEPPKDEEEEVDTGFAKIRVAR
jgi:PAS domain S-box-containing protein